MLKVIFHVAAISILLFPIISSLEIGNFQIAISYYLMAEASGDGKSLLKENLQDQRS